MRHCSICFGTAHNARTCPRGEPTFDQDAACREGLSVVDHYEPSTGVRLVVMLVRPMRLAGSEWHYFRVRLYRAHGRRQQWKLLQTLRFRRKDNQASRKEMISKARALVPAYEAIRST